MKKLLSIILCLVLISCSAMPVFANGNETPDDSGEVLYYQQFGKVGDDLIVENIPSAGLRGGDVGITSIDEETGYLTAIIGKDTVRRKLVSLDNIVPADGTYTVEFTYRMKYGRYNASSVQLGWETENLTILEFTGNDGLKLTYDGGDTSTQAYEANFGKDVIGFQGVQTEFEGNWVTAKVEVTNNVLTGHSFIYNGEEYEYAINYSNYNGEEIDADALYFRGYSMNADFSSIRVVKGVGYTEENLKGAMATASYSELTNDNTLYYQRFGETDNGDKIVASVAAAGMTADTGGSISDNGYYYLNSDGNSRKVGSYLNLNLPQADTYTVELAYRYTEYGNSNNSAFQIGWGECATNKYHLLQFQTGNGLRFTEYHSNGEINQEDFSWPSDEAKTTMKAKNEWINVAVVVKASKIVKCIFTSNGYTFEMDNATLGFNLYEMENDQLYFRIYNAKADISYIRITEGATPTEYRGVYETTSYNGYVDPMVSNVGLQEAINANSVRLVGEILGTNFSEAGFEMNISYTDKAGNTQVSTEQLKPETVHTAYKSIKAGDGMATPSVPNYYLIVLEVSDIPTDITDVVITFRPYAVSGEKAYYGQTYVYDHTTQEITIAK